MSTVSVECPCGTTFSRERKRGRPALWCETCRELPIQQRPERTTEVTNEDGTVTTAPAGRTMSRLGQWDEFDYEARERITEGCAQAGRDMQALYARRFEAFPESKDPARDVSDWYAEELRAVYARER